MSILEHINSPADLKRLSPEQLPALAGEIRQVLIDRITITGGHMGSNLGMVEATIALHYVFDSPKDKFVFDVSHQCYTHKLLTGRKDGFVDPAHFYDYSGYTNPQESEHDHFLVGHTATSVSLATGLAKARDLKGETGNVIAIIGDGSMSGGEAFEGLNNAAMLNSNFIVLFNDNEMSISPNQGGMYQNFARLRRTKGMAECNFFKTFGFDYFYVEDGNDVAQLLSVLRQVKDMPRPTVVHIHTQKGKGLAWAEADREAGHYAMPSGFDASAFANMESYDSITTDFLLKKMEKDPTVIAITPATATVTGLTTEFRQKAGNQFVDVGIAEEHAVAFASGLAKNGAKPVLMITSSFLQRAYDQVIQDLALNGNPATILVYVNGLSPADATHCGVFDIPMLGNIPGLVCLAPAFKEEYVSMLNWSIEQTETPVIIRVPSAVISYNTPMLTDFTKYQTVQQGGGVAILGLGSFFSLAQEIGKLLEQRTSIQSTIINPRIFSVLDVETLEQLKTSHSIVITLEDGMRSGGFGEKIAAFYGTSNIKIMSFGGDKEFNDRVPLETQYQKYRLTPAQIVSAIECCMKGTEL